MATNTVTVATVFYLLSSLGFSAFGPSLSADGEAYKEQWKATEQESVPCKRINLLHSLDITIF